MSGFAAAFLASFVEFVEALTIVLAVGATHGWRRALGGAAAGAAILAVLGIGFGPALARLPVGPLRIGLGILLLLFGTRWLRKAVLRAAGRKSLHDEAEAYAAETSRLSSVAGAAASVAAAKAVLVEGLEVLFLVLAIGAAGHTMTEAWAGAAAALAVVIALGLALRAPLTRVPENLLKFGVGAIASGFGIFWIAEGMGWPWPGEDLAIPVLAAAWAGLGWALVARLRRAA